MVLNYPGPYELRFKYVVDSLEHECRFSVNLQGTPNPGDVMNTIFGLSRDGTAVNMAVVIDNFWTAIDPFFDNAYTTFGACELWQYTPNTFDSQFVSAYNTAVAPSYVLPFQPASYMIYTWRTTEGGIMKLVLLETTSPSNAVQPYPTASPQANLLFDLFTDASGFPAVGRDTSYPFAALRRSLGQNESVWRKRYR